MAKLSDIEGIGEAYADTQVFLKKYCIDCHGADTAEGDVRFDKVDQLPIRERVKLY
ncbi:MAG: c-type cytochrome domain-containing protein, partial [bacterium]